MDTSALIFDISRTDNTDWLAARREEIEADVCLAEQERIELRAAIDERFSQLNLLALQKRGGTDSHTN